VVQAKTRVKDEKPGKIRRFLEFLHIKKKQPKVYTTSPELQRYELDQLLEDISYYGSRLPDDHPQKSGLESAVGTLDKLGNKNMQDATQRAQQLCQWVKDELAKPRPKPPTAPASPPLQPTVAQPDATSARSEPQPQPLSDVPAAPPQPTGKGKRLPLTEAFVAPPPAPPQSPKAPPVIKAEKLTEFSMEKTHGSGQFATTYKMTSPDKTSVALKVPKGKVTPTTEEDKQKAAEKEQEFKKEAAFYQELEDKGGHPNIAKCYGYQTVGTGENAMTGLVLENIEGPNGKDAMDDLNAKYQSGQISAEEFWGVMQYTLKQMLQAADFMTKEGVVHLDMKPDNVMIDAATGEVKVVDFGAAVHKGDQSTKPRTPVGFTAPEFQLRTRSGDTSDAFGVGASAYAWGEQDVFSFHQSGRKMDPTQEDYIAQGRQAIEAKPHPHVPERPGEPEPIDVQFRDLLKEVNKWIAYLEGQLKKLEFKTHELTDTHREFAAPGRLRGELEAIRSLAAKATQLGDAAQLGDAVGVLKEAKARMDAAEHEAGQHDVETLYTDFVNQLMHPDPSKRLTPEQALAHPFMKSQMLDDEAAKHVLIVQSQPPGAATDPGEKEPDEKRWKALHSAALDAERQVKALRSARPEDATQRQVLLSQIQAIAKGGPGGKTSADNAWKQLRPIRDQLDGLLAAATADQQERQKFQAKLTKAGRLLQSFAKLAGNNLSKFEKLFDQAQACAKPGCVLDEGEKFLVEINQKIQLSFSIEQRQEVLRQGLAKVESRVSNLAGESAKQAQTLLTQAKSLADSNDKVDEALDLLDQLAQLVQLSLAKAVKKAKEGKKPAPQTASDPYFGKNESAAKEEKQPASPIASDPYFAKNESNENKVDPYFAKNESPQTSERRAARFTMEENDEDVEEDEGSKSEEMKDDSDSDDDDNEEELKQRERRRAEAASAYSKKGE